MTDHIHDLHNGDHILSWFDDTSDYAEVVFYANGVSISVNRKDLPAIAEELSKAARMLELYESQTTQAG